MTFKEKLKVIKSSMHFSSPCLFTSWLIKNQVKINMTQDLRFFLITMKNRDTTKEVWAKLDLENR